ncbi:MAG TPA: hypothetical protein VGS12_04270 [Caulobacteraceae bacterium]|nr:hypothetical protein [Caulobacteraceae bacterium]
MREFIDVHGASGAVYRFNLLREGHPLSPMGGNFLYVREKTGGYDIVHVGESQSLLADARGQWDQAVKTHGVTHLFSRLNVSERMRKLEHEDISKGLSLGTEEPIPLHVHRAEPRSA